MLKAQTHRFRGRTIIGPRRPQDGREQPQGGQKYSPRGSQEAPKTAQKAPKMAPNAPKQIFGNPYGTLGSGQPARRPRSDFCDPTTLFGGSSGPGPGTFIFHRCLQGPGGSARAGRSRWPWKGGWEWGNAESCNLLSYSLVAPTRGWRIFDWMQASQSNHIDNP